MLIKCPECHKKISSTTETCPYCGYNIKTFIAENGNLLKPKKSFMKSHLIAILIGLILGSSAGIYNINTVRTDSSAFIGEAVDPILNIDNTQEFLNTLSSSNTIREENIYSGDTTTDKSATFTEKTGETNPFNDLTTDEEKFFPELPSLPTPLYVCYGGFEFVRRDDSDPDYVDYLYKLSSDQTEAVQSIANYVQKLRDFYGTNLYLDDNHNWQVLDENGNMIAAILFGSDKNIGYVMDIMIWK